MLTLIGSVVSTYTAFQSIELFLAMVQLRRAAPPLPNIMTPPPYLPTLSESMTVLLSSTELISGVYDFHALCLSMLSELCATIS